ncbi:hypothetical protein EHQ86_10945 [Leptospira yasudae]|nr:hypothetical protein EHQ86_10945 [Leptospira yasudae]
MSYVVCLRNIILFSSFLLLFHCASFYKQSGKKEEYRVHDAKMVALKMEENLQIIATGEVGRWLKDGQKVSIELHLLSIQATEPWWEQEEAFRGAEIDLRVWIKEDNGSKIAYIASNEGFEIIPIARQFTEQDNRQYSLFLSDQVETNDQTLTLNIVVKENDQILLPSKRQKLGLVLDGIKDASLAAIEKNVIKAKTPLDSLTEAISIIWLLPSLIADGIDTLTESQPFLTTKLNLARSIFYKPYGPSKENVKVLVSEYKMKEMEDYTVLPIDSNGKLNLTAQQLSSTELIRHIFTVKAGAFSLKFSLVATRKQFIDSK